MALLPVSPGILLSSSATPIDSILIDRDDAGGAHGRSMFAGQAKSFVRRYRFISSADVTTLIAFYDANRTVTFTQTWLDGVTYTCIWTGSGHFFDIEIGPYWFGQMTMTMSAPV